MGSKHPRMDTAVKVLQQTILVSLFYNVLLPKVHFLCWDLGEKSKVHLSAQQNEGTTVNALGTNELTNFKKRFAIPNRLRCPTGYWNLTLQWEFAITLKVALVAYSSLHSCSTPPKYFEITKAGHSETGFTTLQSMMNAKLSKQRFWHCYENGVIETIQTIPHNLYVSFKSASLT